MHNIYFESIFHSPTLIQLLKNNYANIVLITDDNVGPIYAEKLLNALTAENIQATSISIAHGESNKTRKTKAKIEDDLLALHCNRDTCLLALGGGVVCDLVGFVAATYNRGIPVIYLPSSLLGMVDAALGGKTGVNTTYAKNSIGTFTEPKAVITDINLLASLPEQEYHSALSEIVKHALVFDQAYFSYLEENIHPIKQRHTHTLEPIIKRSCEIKLSIVREDRLDKAKREILNLGHTFGHAIEAASNFTLMHGHAVSIGLVMEAALAKELGYLSENDVKRIINMLRAFDLPIALPKGIDMESVKTLLQQDKKTKNHQTRFVILTSIGKVLQENNFFSHVVTPALIDKALNTLPNGCYT